MGNKTLIRLLAALATIGVLALIVHLTGAGKLKTGSIKEDLDRELVIEDMKPAVVNKVRIVGVENQLNFVRTEAGWVLAERDNYPADGKAIDRLVLDAARLKIRQQPSLSASSLGSVQLLDPKREGATAEDSARVITFIGEDGKEKGTLWLGKMYEVDTGRPGMFGNSSEDAGRFVRGGESETVFLIEQTFADVETDASRWINQDFFQVSQVKSVERKTGDAKEDWKLVLDDPAGEFRFADSRAGEEIDVGKVGAMKNAFASPRFVDVLTGEEAKQKPDAVTFVVETFEGYTYTVIISEADPAGEIKLTVDAEATFPEQRIPSPEETEEETKLADEAFARNLKSRQDKLAEVKKVADRVFRTRTYFVDSLNKKRSELLLQPGDGAGPGAGSAGGPAGGGLNIPGLEGGLPGFPGGNAIIPSAPASKPQPKPQAEPKEEKPAAPAEPKLETATEPAEKPAAEEKAEKPKPDSEPKADPVPTPEPAAAPPAPPAPPAGGATPAPAN